ncbi:MAG: DUF402 domain-containing protein [Anaerolineae bacterium]|nr:DUF402 domain-containing protein [Anaerolineae bacterium]
MRQCQHVSITKLDHTGRPVLTYPGECVYSDEQITVARCLWSHPYSFDLGPFTLEPGDIFIECYYPQHWFNIFKIYDASGLLKGWYCNITTPARVSIEEIVWKDLALDLLILPDGHRQLLDEKEFAELELPQAARQRALQALHTLEAWAQARRFPFQELPPSLP